MLHATIFPPLSFLAWWNVLFIAIYPLSALFRHTVFSPAEERLFGGCQGRPIMRWQSICCCWSGMSNGITTVLITSSHTCTPPCATHLIAPRQLLPCYRPWYLLMIHFPRYGMSITAFVGSDLYLAFVSGLQHFWHRDYCHGRRRSWIWAERCRETGAGLFSAVSGWTWDIRL